MRHTIRSTPEGYLYCEPQLRDKCRGARLLKEVLLQLASPTLIHSPATLPAPGVGTKSI